jgi:pyruvate dehydrogenase E2 component (dihydrolipoamide acetyltransferase)
MARWEFKLPDIGEGITEGEIVDWLIRPGDAVVEDQPMVEVMTDKATVTITAPKAGTVIETRGKIGEIMPVHAVLVVFDLAGAAATSDSDAQAAPSGGTTGRASNGAAKDDEGPAATAVGELRDSLPGLEGAGRSHASAPQFASAVSRVEADYFNEKPKATPATRKLARDMSVDLRRVPPSGPLGRVTKRDVESFGRPASTLAPATGDIAAARAPSGHGGHAANSGPEGAREERVPFAGLRRRIAQRLALAMRTAAPSTFVEECDAGELKALRVRLAGIAEAKGVKLTFLPFIVKATVAALKRHPMINASLDEATNELVLKKYFHIGIATATDSGLIVPVVRDADRKSILEIARDIDRLAALARSGGAKSEDLQGSTFTITSLGALGGLMATPIVNFPEVAILGVHRMKQRPVVKDGQIVAGDVMNLSLSFDHRVVDGHVGAAFVYEVIGYLEHPDRLMLELV